ILERQARPAKQLQKVHAGPEAEAAEARDEDRSRPELLDRCAQRLIEAPYERRHPNDRHHADDDPKHRERGAHLVRAERVERHAHDFAEQPVAHRHQSLLSASIGSRPAAREAGYSPKNRPTPAVIPMPSATDHGARWAVIGDSAVIARAARKPSTM